MAHGCLSRAPRFLAIAVAVVLVALSGAQVWAHTAVGGNARTSNVTITSGTFASVLDVAFTLPARGDQRHDCAVTASATLINPGMGVEQNWYRFALALDGDVAGGSAGVVDFDDTAVADENREVISVTYRFADVGAGAHTIQLVGQKAFLPDLDVVVDTSSMTVVCGHALN